MPVGTLKLRAQTPPADACILQLERGGLFVGAQEIVQPSFDEGAQRGSRLGRMAAISLRWLDCQRPR